MTDNYDYEHDILFVFFILIVIIPCCCFKKITNFFINFITYHLSHNDNQDNNQDTPLNINIDIHEIKPQQT
jgi:hypothetical protein